MKLQSTECPSCGAPFSIDAEKNGTIFCPYCGTQILLKEGNSIEIEYNRTNRNIDDAQIRRVDAEKEVQLKRLETDMKKSRQRNFTIIFIAAVVVITVCLFLFLKHSIYSDANTEKYRGTTQSYSGEHTSQQNTTVPPLEETTNTTEVYPIPTNTELSYGFLDRALFSESWEDGIYRCGSDFPAGEYFIMSISDASALFDVANSPDGFSWTRHRVFRKITANVGQYVEILPGGIMVSTKELDMSNMEKYGVFLVGKDLPEGDYKITTITDYCPLTNTKGVRGAYQISNDSPENTPESCDNLFHNQAYITLKTGQYLTINNAKLTLCDSAVPNVNAADKEPAADVVEENLENKVETAYNIACSLSADQLKKEYNSFLGKTQYYYDGLQILSEDVEWLDNPQNTSKRLNQGALYRTVAKKLAGYFMNINDGSAYCEVLTGKQWVDSTMFEPLAKNAETFIVLDDSSQLETIMRKFQSLQTVTGTFDFGYSTFGKYSFDISNLTECAEEMQISEEMLGYIFALLDEFAPTIAFSGNSVHFEYAT